MANILYICYSGIREPLVQTQFLPYLRQIRELGVTIHFLTFEPANSGDWAKDGISNMRKALADEGIIWHSLKYHKWPSVPATLFDISLGAIKIWRMIRSEGITVLHGRIHVPTLMAVIAKRFSSKKVKVLFDIRGLMPEEYTEGGLWKPNGWVYKSMKLVERWLLKNSDGFVVLTEKAREIFFPESKKTGFDKLGRPVEVIPCCVDLRRFEMIDGSLRQATRQKLKIEDRFVFAYVGSLGSNWYMPAEMAKFLGVAKRRHKEAFAMILTQTPSEIIRPQLESEGFGENDFLIKRVPPNEIPDYLNAADAAISFILPCYSKLGSSPTKNAEYLASGLPLITNSGVGDTAEFTREDDVGYAVDHFTSESYEQALDELEKLKTDPNLYSRCRKSVLKRFDLNSIAGNRYRRIYRELLK